MGWRLSRNRQRINMAAPKGNENRAKIKGEKRVMVSYRLSLATIALMKAYAEAKGLEKSAVLEMAIIKMCS